MPSFEALRIAVQNGADLLMCHEPTFWNHLDDKPDETGPSLAKLRFIEEHGLVVMRNHDCWDRWPALGIPWAWARFLGLKGAPRVVGADGYQHRYDMPSVPLGEFAGRVAERTASLGAPLVEVAGDLDKPVSKIGVGTGCGCDVFVYLEMGCDCCIVCDDGTSYWRHVQYAADQGVPVICVNHGTSEEPGMATLAQYINEHLDGVAAEHLRQTCPFELVGPRRP
jgi:putative NIF3 family GTP cyclohydrolase 1 type 2